MKRKYFLIFTLLLATCSFSFGQSNIAPILFNNPYNIGDTVVLKLDNSGGSVQWQESLDLMNWTNIPGQNDDSLVHIVVSPKYLRASVSYGNCDPYFSDTLYINNGLIPFASFVANTVVIMLSDTIFFTDLSLNNPTSWFWDFGDGSNSTTQHPYHVYQLSGTYSVSLIASNQFGSDTSLVVNYIIVQDTASCPPTVTDIEGYVYPTVLIGTQCWMKKNMRAIHYADGSPLMQVVSNIDWNNLGYIDQAYCYYFNDSAVQSNTGIIYTWQGAMGEAASSNTVPSGVQGICPNGWHLPSDEEWKILEGFVDSQYGYPNSVWDGQYWRGNNSGINLKAISGWFSGGNGSDIYGFLGLPTGYRTSNGGWGGPHQATFWSTTEFNNDRAWYRELGYLHDNSFRNNYTKDYGFRVRCISDSIISQLSLPTVTTSNIINITQTTAEGGGDVVFDGGDIVTSRGICWNSTGNPTIADFITVDGSGIGTFISSLTSLSVNTQYFVRAYATNSVGTAYGIEVSFISLDTLNTLCPTTVADVEGNIYSTNLIGNQCWMAENLRVTMYSDSIAIPIVTSNSAWNILGFSDPAFCYYDNDSSSTALYGALYNWPAAMKGSASSGSVPSGVQGICPVGWHLPSDEEWKILEGEADSQYGYPNSVWDGSSWRGYDSGFNLKATSSWASGGNGSDLYGFSALPGGHRSNSGSFGGVNNNVFWSSSEFNNNNAWYRELGYQYDNSFRNNYPKDYGFRVRCIKD